MSKRTSSSIRRASRGAASIGIAAPDERRTHHRLRELCDEVIASFRVARGSELLSASERAEANQILSQLTPPVARASA